MSLYNMINGVNPMTPILLAMLGINISNVPRFRDCYFDGENIVIYTRTGGGNRDWYESPQSCRDNYPESFDGEDEPTGPWNSDLQALPGYVRDEDDDFDSTYASFYFNVSPHMEWVIPHLAAEGKTPGEKMREFIDRLNESSASEDPQVQKVMAQMKPIMEQIETALNAETGSS